MDRFESRFVLIRDNWIDLVSCKFKYLYITKNYLNYFIRYTSTDSFFRIVKNKDKFQFYLVALINSANNETL